MSEIAGRFFGKERSWVPNDSACRICGLLSYPPDEWSPRSLSRLYPCLSGGSRPDRGIGSRRKPTSLRPPRFAPTGKHRCAVCGMHGKPKGPHELPACLMYALAIATCSQTITEGRCHRCRHCMNQRSRPVFDFTPSRYRGRNSSGAAEDRCGFRAGIGRCERLRPVFQRMAPQPENTSSIFFFMIRSVPLNGCGNHRRRPRARPGKCLGMLFERPPLVDTSQDFLCPIRRERGTLHQSCSGCAQLR